MKISVIIREVKNVTFANICEIYLCPCTKIVINKNRHPNPSAKSDLAHSFLASNHVSPADPLCNLFKYPDLARFPHLVLQPSVANSTSIEATLQALDKTHSTHSQTVGSSSDNHMQPLCPACSCTSLPGSSRMRSLPHPSLHIHYSNFRSKPKLQAWTRMYILHNSPAPFLHLTSLSSSHTELSVSM